MPFKIENINLIVENSNLFDNCEIALKRRYCLIYVFLLIFIGICLFFADWEYSSFSRYLCTRIFPHSLPRDIPLGKHMFRIEVMF